MRGRRMALLGMAALFAAMLGRAGFVDWLSIFQGVAMVFGGILFALTCILAVVACLGVVLSPVGLLTWGLVRLFDGIGKPRADGSGRPAVAGAGGLPAPSRAMPGDGFTMR